MESGNFYHVFNRGNNRENIFKERRNYFFFLQRMQHYLEGFIELHSYCLMPNHFHLLIRVKDHTPEFPTVRMPDEKLSPLEKGFKNFFISYSKAINKSYGRVGSLFQCNYVRKPIEGQLHYLTNVAYIHFNPVKAGFCRTITDWGYSSYNELLTDADSWLEKQEVHQRFGGVEAMVQFHLGYVERQK